MIIKKNVWTYVSYFILFSFQIHHITSVQSLNKFYYVEKTVVNVCKLEMNINVRDNFFFIKAQEYALEPQMSEIVDAVCLRVDICQSNNHSFLSNLIKKLKQFTAFRSFKFSPCMLKILNTCKQHLNTQTASELLTDYLGFMLFASAIYFTL